MLNRPTPALLDQFAAIVGPAHALTDPAATEPYRIEWRDRFLGSTPMVLRPGSVAEVSAILALANAERIAIVPQSGNTGLVGGQVPDSSGTEIVLSLDRMTRIRAVDPEGFTLTAEAGAILADVQKAAETVDRLFPLSLGSEGSCRIGGNISTNAGGTAVLAYGNMRDLVLGLEVVLADGRVWEGLNALRKDNTGYDLKQLFIGGEGTLGIVTAAVLKLFPRPRGQAVAFAALASPADALGLFSAARDRAGHDLTGFELMPRIGMDFVLRHIPGTRDPLAAPAPWYALMEISSGDSDETAQATLEDLLAAGFERGVVQDAAIAQSLAEAKAFWHIRHGMSEAQKPEGGSIKHDVSVPVAKVPAFLDEAIAAVEAMVPGCRPVPFGHLGDGNIHFNISQPIGADKEAYLARWEEMNALVHGIVATYGGSISAEHGIGRLKRDLLPGVKGPVAMAMMRGIKDSFDPNGILNPGKMLAAKE
ncbi:FAD-binding oxidoreductase [Kaistia dalseonensis]|uniref:FAD/FMN-containing dehydrogenase n=1 Tax=Kaistia dalseonensis TaxID=410840 RepID=A0ABU0HCH3_9HYPH|nr:FAD-binding oxidoreductase [Kaistia dalseonensis]MCX5497374.1 FAD-binding oxidoreductase [Kaistia dalseonensis]MDQ0440012.1 FAD/FMN-containing dehydrogenase [Kaistia dalseonensis]